MSSGPKVYPDRPDRRTVLKRLAGAAALALRADRGFASSAADVVLTPDMALSRAALRELLQKMPRRGGRLVFSPGRFAFPEMDLAFGFEAFDELDISGPGAELIFKGSTKPFFFKQCRGLSVSGLTVDWQDPPFRQGIVKTVADAGRTVEIDLDASQLPYSGARVQAVLAVEPGTGLVSMAPSFDFYGDPRVRRLDDAGFRLELKFTTPTPLAPGVGLVLRQQVFGSNALSFQSCSGQIDLADVAVRAAPGMAVFARACKSDIQIKRFAIAPAPGSGRLMSTNADGLHFGSCVGKITVDDCDFAFMGDDAINVYAAYARVLRRIDPRTLVVVNRFDQVLSAENFASPNGPLQAMSGADLGLEGEDRLASVEPGERAILHFEEDLPASVSAGDLIRAQIGDSSITVTGCRFGPNRGRGVVGHQNVRIENNDFRNQSRSAIFLAADTYWLNCCEAREIVIRGNTIAESCRSRLGQAAIEIDAVIFSDPAAPSAVGKPRSDFNHDVLIVENHMKNTHGPAIGVTSTTRLKIESNDIREAAAPVIRLANLGECSITDNACFPASKVQLAGDTPRRWIFGNNHGLSVDR